MASGRTGKRPVLFMPHAADLDPLDLKTALLRAAVGDYATEAAVLLRINAGHWLLALAADDLITADYDDDSHGPLTWRAAGIGWAQITWTEIDRVIGEGRIVGYAGQLRLPRAAASLADGQPIAVGDLAAGLDRDNLRLLLAAISHAGGSHEPGATNPGGYPGDPLPPLVPWPIRH